MYESLDQHNNLDTSVQQAFQISIENLFHLPYDGLDFTSPVLAPERREWRIGAGWPPTDAKHSADASQCGGRPTGAA